MSSRPLIALTLAAALALAGCGDDDPSGTSTTTSSTASTAADESTTTAAATPTVIDVVVVDGEPQGGERHVRLSVGELVSLRVEADVSDEVHVHGYDLSDDVAPGRPAELAFTADIPGQFEVELEGSGVVLVALTVT
ncbi:MAG: hypothetical protein ACT452_05745 [Microthrixaceae bacterium]